MDDPRPRDRVSQVRSGWWSRDRALVVVLGAATVLLVWLCWLIARPFLNPLAWALAIAVIAHPLHGWICRRIKNSNVAAGVAVFAVAVIIIAPMIFVGHSVFVQATAGAKSIQAALEGGEWRELLARSPWAGQIFSALEQQANLGAQLQGLASEIATRFSKAVAGSAWAVVELLLALFVLFFFFRDRRAALEAFRSFIPLSEPETKEVFTRVGDTIHATIYGTVTVAIVQGTLGGLMFWWLGLPAPVLWGAVMALLAIVPVLGAFVIWVPAAIFLAMRGDWGKAAILAAWGVIVIGFIDNLLYPILVGKRLRLHTLPVFIAIVGGLALFGASGLILGPVVLTLTIAILDIWRRRTAHGRTAEKAIKEN